MSKTIKVLSDGTIAKVGMIITCDLFFNKEIIKINNVKTGSKPKNAILRCNDWDVHTTSKYNPWVHINNIRKSTPEERKQYYQELYAKHQ